MASRPGTRPAATRPSYDERVALGKHARKRALRSSHAAFEPPPDRPEPIELLAEQAATRVPELVPIRYGTSGAATRSTARSSTSQTPTPSRASATTRRSSRPSSSAV